MSQPTREDLEREVNAHLQRVKKHDAQLNRTAETLIQEAFRAGAVWWAHRIHRG